MPNPVNENNHGNPHDDVDAAADDDDDDGLEFIIAHDVMRGGVGFAAVEF